MKSTPAFAGLLLFLFLLPAHLNAPWKITKTRRYDIYFQKTERQALNTCRPMFAAAADTVEAFFGQPFLKKFDIRIHPNRAAMDAQWQQAWNMPGFQSECWMVASGMATQLDLLAPQKWSTEACEHDWADRAAVQKLIAHELVHVFHGQRNASPDFSDVQGLDWFVEGLAVYASGQCDSARLAPVKRAVAAGKVPDSLDQFWTGPLRYGLSGSVVHFIDLKYGRQKLLELLPLKRKNEFYQQLGTTEEQLLKEWRDLREE